eukprot:COSAG05_NODE_20097_length_283_cov_0.831522_1_plen_48_part_10
MRDRAHLLEAAEVHWAFFDIDALEDALATVDVLLDRCRDGQIPLAAPN